MINPESSSPEPQAQSGFAEALKIIEQKYGISTTDLGGQKEKIRKSISAEIEQLLTENFRIPAAVLMAKINEISRQLKPMELQLVNSMAMDIRAGRQVGNFDSLMMQMSMFDGGGSGRGGHDRKGRSFRAELVVLCVLLMLLLVACMPGVPVVGVGPVVVNEQGTPQSGLVVPAENTAIPPTETATDIPATPTEMPTLTPTVTPTEIPITIDFQFPNNFASFEKQFPLAKIVEFDGHILRCVVDSQNIFTGNVAIGGNLEMRAWARCYFKVTDNQLSYANIPIYVVDKSSGQQFTAFYPDPQPLPSGGNGFSPEALKKVVPTWISTLTSQRVFTMGFGFGTNVNGSDASQKFFRPAIQNLSSDAVTRLSQGDPSGLPTVGGVERFLPAFEYLTDTVK